MSVHYNPIGSFPPIPTSLLKQVLSEADQQTLPFGSRRNNGQINKKELANYSDSLDQRWKYGLISNAEWKKQKEAVTVLQNNFDTIAGATGHINQNGNDRLSLSDIDAVASQDGNATSLSVQDLKKQPSPKLVGGRRDNHIILGLDD